MIFCSKVKEVEEKVGLDEIVHCSIENCYGITAIPNKNTPRNKNTPLQPRVVPVSGLGASDWVWVLVAGVRHLAS